jgi:hypothetical protein
MASAFWQSRPDKLYHQPGNIVKQQNNGNKANLSVDMTIWQNRLDNYNVNLVKSSNSKMATK